MGVEDTRRCSQKEIDSVRSRGSEAPAERRDEEPGDEPIVVAPPPPPRLQIGARIEGRLRVLRLLGRGGMSEVYEAYDEPGRRTVAIKLMLTDLCVDAQLGIFAEARALVRFRHPNVVRFFGVGAIAAQPFIELENAAGGSLAERCERGAVPSLCEAIDLVIPVADAVAALHAAGTVHRDIKADNVLLAADGRPVLCDFGLALQAEDLPALPHGIVGTPAYMAPEAILGITETFEQYAWADQYSLGVLTYFALTGTVPFDAPTPSGLFYAQMAVAPEPPSLRRAGIPPELDRLVGRALAKRPGDRFANVAELREALAHARATLGPAPVPPRTPLRESSVRGGAPALKHTVVAA